MQAQKVAIRIVLIIGTSILVSCSTYRNGFLLPLALDCPTTEISQPDFILLTEEKEKLNNETNKIVSNIKQALRGNQAVPAVDINRLFENLHNQYQIDQKFQSLCHCASNDSLKTQAWKNLIRSSDFYNRSLQQEKYLRRIINRGDVANNIKKKTLLHSQKFLWNNRNRKTARKEHLRLQSQSQTKFRFIREKEKDNLANTTYKIAGFGSELFGRSISKIRGKHQTNKNAEQILPHLQKWDIVCQKTPNCLTDKFIPGYFGHSGIYLGDSLFMEAIQKGVVYSCPEDFLVGSDILILRPSTISSDQNALMQKRAKNQLGKKYDFNFNIESPDRIVCTELIFLIYDQIDWKNRRIAGWYTISPDDLVNTSLDNNKLETPIYLNKKDLIEYPDHRFVEELLKQK